MLNALIERGAFRTTVSAPRRRGRLHVMPTTVGLEEAVGPGYSFDGRKRGPLPFAVLQHTISGCGRLRFGRQFHRVAPGQTMLVTIPHTHRYWLEAGETWSFFWIGLTGQEALRLLYAIQSAAGPVLTLDHATIDRLAGFCLELGDRAADRDAVGSLSAIAYAVLMCLVDDVLGRHHAIRAEANSDDVERVCRHVRTNLDQPLNVSDLAAVAGYSRAHFSRLFAAETGLAPAEFICRERMRLASRLLANASLSVKDISSACGYADPNYFAKAFRKHFETSPTEFRAAASRSDDAARPVLHPNRQD
ncbi:helix-turn-helix transcriptional regulator [Acidisoma cellulosilytica]|uniref:Helix-turn-helix transcriptional regulator n=1 Tax=Acidisoma cellulosilyticum TaxID=2802395 RepID=A0A964E4G3_9PROT|nr:AraC family transcriptional regulator [Acidisoma cellulosilyticum]MCB8881444.1 helix-turn-helix transcriptional regulator [Acidisoma cellulosilyticum]